MKKMILLIMVCVSSQMLIAQSYTTAAGLRLGNGFGVSVQQKILKTSTIEGIISPSFNSRDVEVEALYEVHKKVLSKRFNIYTGTGLHHWFRDQNSDAIDKANTGLSFILGGEITISRLNLSVDFKPTFDFLGGKSVFQSQSAITARYVFVKQKKKKFNWKFWEKD